MAVKEEELEVLKGLLVPVGIGTALIVGFTVLVQAFAFGRRINQDGQYQVSVRYPGQWHDLRQFVQPDNPDVVAAYSPIGPNPWALYDWVCRNINYRRDIGEFWQTPSETLRGIGDCEDSSILLTSLIRASGTPNCYVALGSLGGYGHAWCQLDGLVLETTYTYARPVPDPQDYKALVAFNDYDVFQAYPGALEDIFSLRRDDGVFCEAVAVSRTS